MSGGLIVTLTLPGRVAVKKNGQRIVGSGKRKRRILTPQYQQWEARAAIAVCGQVGSRINYADVWLVDQPCRAVFRLYYANRQWESDCSNAVEGPQDLLVKLGVLKDDKLIVRLEVEKFFGHEPRVEIELYKYKQEEG